jgi:hypothetical protein
MSEIGHPCTVAVHKRWYRYYVIEPYMQKAGMHNANEILATYVCRGNSEHKLA